ncbi:MAG: hypothetical protein KF901_00725 [Myxococcales bacterium]|nr:hypothetical protein [Myxococcales bacterium]
MSAPRTRDRLLPVVAAVAASAGLVLALVADAFLLGWAPVVGVGLGTAVFMWGLVNDPGDAALVRALVALGTFGLAFVALSAPLTLAALAELDPRIAAAALEPLDVEDVAAARALLVPRWATLAVAALVGLGAAWRWRR